MSASTSSNRQKSGFETEKTAPRPHDRRDVWALALLVLIAVIAFWPLFAGRAFYFGDLELYFHPMAAFWADELRAGRVPLWAAEQAGGMPFAGNPQAWMLYPSALLLLVFSPVAAINATIVLHLVGGGVLFFLWTRRGRLNLSPWAALLGALTWMLGGYFVTKAQFPNMLQTLALVPLMLWATERFAARPDARGIVLLGGAWGLGLLAAHAQISFFTIYGCLIYLVFCRLVPRGEKQSVRPLRMASALGASLALAIALAAAQILPILELMPRADRQNLTLEGSARFVLPFAGLTNFVWPYRHGNPNVGTWTGANGPHMWETASYIGIVPFALALGIVGWTLLSALRRSNASETRANVWFWLLIAVLGTWLALGPDAGLYRVAYAVVPGVARFHDTGRMLLGAALGLPILAALGFERFLVLTRSRPRWMFVPIVLLGAAALDLSIFARGVYPTRTIAELEQKTAPFWPRDGEVEARQVRLLHSDAIALQDAFQNAARYRASDHANQERYARSLPLNLHQKRRWLAQDAYEPLASQVGRERAGSTLLGEDSREMPDIGVRRLERDSVRWVGFFRAYPPQSRPDFTRVWTSDWASRDGRRLTIYRVENALPRARWKAANGVWQASSIRHETANRIELEVPSTAQTIELADTFWSGWHAHEIGTENGRQLSKLPIGATERNWKTVELAPSSNQAARRVVRFSYEPTTWRFGLFISLLTTGFFTAFGAASWAGKTKSARHFGENGGR